VSKLPANGFTRLELQSLITKAIGLLPASEQHLPDLAVLTNSLLIAAAALEGFLAEQIVTASSPLSDKQAVANPHNWRYEWLGSTINTQTRIGTFCLRCEQQTLLLPQERYLGTGRFRVTTTDPKTNETTTHVSLDPCVLRDCVVAYVERFADAIPHKMYEQLLSTDFPERGHAVQDDKAVA
jgi:hypothetical protein